MPCGPARNARQPICANRDIENTKNSIMTTYSILGLKADPTHSLKTPKKNRPCLRNYLPIDSFFNPAKINKIKLEISHVSVTLIETAAIPIEIINLRSEAINLDSRLPFIKVRPGACQELNTPISAKDIPLVAVALKIIDT